MASPVVISRPDTLTAYLENDLPKANLFNGTALEVRYQPEAIDQYRQEGFDTHLYRSSTGVRVLVILNPDHERVLLDRYFSGAPNDCHIALVQSADGLMGGAVLFYHYPDNFLRSVGVLGARFYSREGNGNGQLLLIRGLTTVMGLDAHDEAMLLNQMIVDVGLETQPMVSDGPNYPLGRFSSIDLSAISYLFGDIVYVFLQRDDIRQALANTRPVFQNFVRQLYFPSVGTTYQDVYVRLLRWYDAAVGDLVDRDETINIAYVMTHLNVYLLKLQQLLQGLALPNMLDTPQLKIELAGEFLAVSPYTAGFLKKYNIDMTPNLAGAFAKMQEVVGSTNVFKYAANATLLINALPESSDGRAVAAAAELTKLHFELHGLGVK